jgi:citrate synthase
MNDDPATAERATGGRGRRTRPPGPNEWPTSLTRIAPNEIEIRGYPVDELMGRLMFSEGIYLLLRGELPSPSIGKLFTAVLLSSLDHGVTPPSTLAARHVASSGSSLCSAVAAGVLAFGTYHGGDIEAVMRCLQEGISMHHGGMSYEDAARTLLKKHCGDTATPPGFGHRIHTRDPRAARLMQLAHELDLDGEHCRLLRVVERVLNAMPSHAEHPLPLNIDGAIAAVCGDLGFGPEIGNGLFIISRVPGLLAHVVEEKSRYGPMRRIDPKDAYYDGPGRRRLPETRK